MFYPILIALLTGLHPQLLHASVSPEMLENRHIYQLLEQGEDKGVQALPAGDREILMAAISLKSGREEQALATLNSSKLKNNQLASLMRAEIYRQQSIHAIARAGKYATVIRDDIKKLKKASLNKGLDEASRRLQAFKERLRQEQKRTARLEAKRLEAQRLEAERRETARLEAQRLEARRRETAWLEAKRLEAERRERARLEAQRLEAERRERAQLEAQRLEAERRETARLEAERREAMRLEAKRLEAERRERARLETQRLEAKRREAARLEAQRLEAERRERVRLETQRLEAKRREAAQLEAQRLEAKRREAARLEAKRLEAKRRETARLEAQRLEAKRRERALLEAQRLEAKRRETARLEAQRLEAKRREAARLEAKRRETARLETERIKALDHPFDLLKVASNISSIFMVDKAKSRLYVFKRNKHGRLKRIADEPVFGARAAPNGIYHFNDILSNDQLERKYGSIAFPIDYPNALDRLHGLSGRVWMYGRPSNSGRLPAQDMQGRFALSEKRFLAMSKHIRLGRSWVIVGENIAFGGDQQALLKSVRSAINSWRRDWESLNTKAYLSHYHPAFKSGGKDLTAWSRYKRRVNRNKRFIRLKLSDFTIIRNPVSVAQGEAMLVEFNQRYQSSNYASVNRKRLYLVRKDAGHAWKILIEENIGKSRRLVATTRGALEMRPIVLGGKAPAARKANKWIVNLASFNSRAGAENFISHIQLPETRIVRTIAEGEPWYRIRMGNYASRLAATRALNKTCGKHGLTDCWLEQIN